MKHCLGRKVFRSLVCALLTSCFLLPGTGTAEPKLSDENNELLWIKKVIPSYEAEKNLTRHSKTPFDKAVLPRHLTSGKWYVHHIDKGWKANDKESGLLILWLYPEKTRSGPVHYLCSECSAFGVVSLVKEGEILSVADHLIEQGGNETTDILTPVPFGNITLWSIERTLRMKGVVTKSRTFFRKSRKRLLPSGTIPISAGNLGVCGSFARAKTKRRGLRGKSDCGTIWNFKTHITPRKKTFKVHEEFQQAKAKRYKLKTKKKSLTYRLKGGRLLPNRRSLRNLAPSSQ